MENLTKNICSPNLEVAEPLTNHLKHLNYYPFEERVFDLVELLKSNINKEYTNTIGATTYEGLARHYVHDGPRKNSIIFNGVYKLAPFSEYMGFIPEENQIEIGEKYNSLLGNPFLNQEFKLVILAPLNNFAEENNIKAIDPIVFAYFTEGENSSERNYLITLTQWV